MSLTFKTRQVTPVRMRTAQPLTHWTGDKCKYCYSNELIKPITRPLSDPLTVNHRSITNKYNLIHLHLNMTTFI